MAYRFDREFDVTLAIGLFDYVADCVPFLKKMQRLSRRKVVATFPRKWTWRAPVRKVRLALRGCPVYFFTRPQVERLMSDVPLRARLAQAGYDKISAFTWPALADRLENIFAAVLGRDGRYA